MAWLSTSQKNVANVVKSKTEHLGIWGVKKNSHVHGCFQKIGILQNGWCVMENPIKMDDLDVPPFKETPTSNWKYLYTSLKPPIWPPPKNDRFSWTKIHAGVWLGRWNCMPHRYNHFEPNMLQSHVLPAREFGVPPVWMPGFSWLLISDALPLKSGWGIAIIQYNSPKSSEKGGNFPKCISWGSKWLTTGWWEIGNISRPTMKENLILQSVSTLAVTLKQDSS